MNGMLPSGIAQAATIDCTLTLPANALTAQGLATPFINSCDETGADTAAFAQAAIVDASGALSIYTPLVISQGTVAAVAPVVPTLPAGATVALWFGFNGNNLRLLNTDEDEHCVNGKGSSLFGQYSYCNAVAWFAQAETDIAHKRITVPSVGIGTDGLACPTVRSASVVDQDQSDNVQSRYLAQAGQTMQDNATNRAAFSGASVIKNPSDNALLTRYIDPALGCTPWMLPDLSDNATPAPSLVADELQAKYGGDKPQMLVPRGDPMVEVNGNGSDAKMNLYRAGVDQKLNVDDNTGNYCRNIAKYGVPRLRIDMALESVASPFPDQASTLSNFLGLRLSQTWGLLDCRGDAPVSLTFTSGIVTGVTYP